MTDAPIAYILKRYPRFSETFVVNEILAHEAAGQAIEIYALGPVQETHFQEAIARVRAPVRRIRHQYHDTELYWQLLTKAHATLPAFDANAALAENHSAATIGQAAVLALKIHERGIRHLHAHFGTQAATIARLAARFAAVTYSITAHAKDIYHEYSEPVNLARKIADAAFTITVSDYNLAHLREQYPAEAPVYRIYNGLDLEQFPYHAPENRPPHLLAVGRLVEKKGFPDLIDAIAALRERGINCTCDIIGDGNQRETLAAHIARLQLADRVRLLGNRSQAEVKNHIRQAAMLIAPSIISADGDRDGLPTILVEAMALGTPCISTNIVGIPELIHDGDTLQIGIGAIPDAVLQSLRERKDLGLHTEMFTDGVMHMINSGNVTGEKKTLHPRKVVSSIIMGTKALYDFVNKNDMIEMYTVDQANTIPYRLVANKLGTQEDLSTSRLDLLE